MRKFNITEQLYTVLIFIGVYFLNNVFLLLFIDFY